MSRQQRRAAERSEKKRRRSKVAASAAMVLGAAGFGAAANAATITVNSNLDTVAVDGVCTLREALTNANDATGADQTGGDCLPGSPTGTQDVVTFAASVTGTITLTSNSYLNVTDAVSIQGPGPATLAIDGNNATQVLYAHAGVTPFAVSITGLTIQNGNGPFGGGGIASRHVNLTLDNDVIQNNVGRYGSGGVHFNGQYATSLTVTNSTISGNSTQRSGRAGGIGVKYTSNGSAITIDHVTITGNHAAGDGGGIYANLVCGATMTISSSVITGNDAGLADGVGGYTARGGGIYVAGQGLALAPSPQGRRAKTNGLCQSLLNINDSTVSGNAADADGGGIFATRYATLSLLRTTVSGNTSSASGGGIYVNFRSTASVSDSTISNNSAAFYGGGLSAYEVGLTVNNTTVNGNTAGKPGGGVYFGAEGGTGPYAGTVNNSIISNNSGGDIYVYTGGTAATLTVSFSDITVPGGNFVDGGNNINVDPLLGALQDNGGPGQGNGSTFRPLTQLPGVPVIDKGDTATAAVPFDERQFPRVEGTAVDMGAVEAAAGTISFSAAAYSGVEGNVATITVTRAGGDATVSADVTVTGGTATPGADYTFVTTTVTFNPGETTKTFTIPLTADGIFDPGETINLALQNLTGGATLGPIPTTVVTINEVGTPGALQFSSATYTIAENGGSATITVQRVGGSSGAVSVAYATSNGTATAGADYTPEAGTLTWADGDTANKTFTVPILDDNIVEGNETVNLTLTNPTNGATLGTANATLTITDFEPGTISVQGGPAVTVNESAGQVIITLTRTVASNGPVTVNFSTSPGTATTPADFTSVNGTVTWADGDTAPKTITIPITVDNVPEPPETFTLNLSTATPGAIVANPVVTITIVDAATIPTLAFWMKLMLALGCAGVGIVMLKNGRVLVIVAATGLALAAAPKLHAATRQPAKSAAHQRSVTAVAAAVTSITTSGPNIVAQVGDTTITVPATRFAVIDTRAGHARYAAPGSVTAGTAAVLAVRSHRVRLFLFDSIQAAQQAAQRIQKP